MALALDIAFTHLRGRKRQTIVSVVGVALGVGFTIAMAALMQGFQEDFVRRVIDNSPHITVKDEYRTPPRQPLYLRHAAGALQLRSQKPRDEVRGIKRAAHMVAVLNRWPGVHAAPTLQGQLFVRYGSKDQSATVFGIDPQQERRVTKIEKDMIAGSLDRLKTTANGIIIGNGLARKLGVALNDTVTAVSVEGVILKMKIVGIFKTGVVTLDDTYSYVLLKKAQVLQKRTNVVNQVRVKLADVNKAVATARMIEERFGYKAESWQEANEGIFGVFVIQNAIMYSTTSAILLVACFGIYNIISTVIYEKARDIAILKSIGFAEPDIRRVFLLEGLAVGVLGSLLGCAIGFGLISIMGAVRINVGGFVELQRFVLKYSPWHYVIASGVAMTAATAAGYLPARKAARLRPVEIIRGAA
jgi:lipoprotein-releasing system permease protein